MPTNIADLFATLKLDAGPFKFGLAEAGQKVVEFTSTAKGAAGPLDDLGKKTSAVGNVLGDTANTTEKLGDKLKDTTDTTEKLGDKLKDTASGPGPAFTSLLGIIKSSLTASLGPFAKVALAAGGTGVALGAVAFTTLKAVGAFTEFATQVRDLSYISGGSAKDVSVLVAGLQNFGVSSETVELGVAKMSSAIEAGSPALNRLGVSTRTTSESQKNGLTMFYETVDALGSMTNEVERNALAREIFGRGWTSIMPILRLGSEEIRRMGEESGRAVSEADITRMNEYKIALHELGEGFERLAISLGGTLVPWLTRFIEFLTPANAKLAELNYTAVDLAANLGAISGVGGRGPITSGGTSDVGAWREGKAGVTVSAVTKIAPENLDELEKRLTLEGQLASLKTAAMTASAYSEEDKLAAAIATVNDQKQKSIDLIKLEYESGKRGVVGSAKALRDKANLEVGITRLAEAGKARLILESELKRSVAYIKSYDDVQEAATKAYDLEITLTDELTAGYLTDYQTREKAITDWERKNITAVLNVMGETQQANALIAKIYEEGSKRKIALQVTEASAETKKLSEMKEKYFFFDDTIREHQSATYIVSQAEIDQARQEGLKRETDQTNAFMALHGLTLNQTLADLDREKTAVQDAMEAGRIRRDQGAALIRDIEDRKTSAILGNYEKEIAASQRAVDAALTAKGIQIDRSLALIAYGYNKEESIRQTNLQNQATAYLVIANQENSMWAAMQSGALTTYASLGSFWGNVSKGFAETFQNVNKALSDSFFDVMTGKFDELGNVAKNFGTAVIRTFADVVAAQATNELIDLLPKIGKTILSAGSWLTNLLSLAEGGTVPGVDQRDTVPAMLSPGEIVLKPYIAEQLKKLLEYLTSQETLAYGGQIPAAEAALMYQGGAAAMYPTGYGIGEEAMGITGAGANTAAMVGAAASIVSGAMQVAQGDIRGGVGISTGVTTGIAAGLGAGAWVLGPLALPAIAFSIMQATEAGRKGYKSSPEVLWEQATHMLDDSGGTLQGIIDTMAMQVQTMPEERWSASYHDWSEVYRIFNNPIWEYLVGRANPATARGWEYSGLTFEDQLLAHGADIFGTSTYALAHYVPSGGEETGRAYGGPVGPGYSGPVGEKGPEWLDIGQGGYGYVTPSSGTAGDRPININIDMRNSIVPERIPEVITRKIVAALREKGVMMPGTTLLPARR